MNEKLDIVVYLEYNDNINSNSEREVLSMLTINELKEILSGINGCTFAGIKAQTPVKLKGGKKNPQQGKIYKLVENGNCMLFPNKKSNGYENMIKRRLEKEGKNPDSFKLGKRAWGKRIENTPLVEHKGKYYLEIIYMQPPKVKYLYENKPIKKDEIEGLPERKEGKQGGLSDENKVYIRTIALENIKELHLKGEVIQ